MRILDELKKKYPGKTMKEIEAERNDISSDIKTDYVIKNYKKQYPVFHIEDIIKTLNDQKINPTTGGFDMNSFYEEVVIWCVILLIILLIYYLFYIKTDNPLRTGILNLATKKKLATINYNPDDYLY